MGRNEEIWAGQAVNLAFKAKLECVPQTELSSMFSKQNEDFYKKKLNQWLEDVFELAKTIYNKGLEKGSTSWGINK